MPCACSIFHFLGPVTIQLTQFVSICCARLFGADGCCFNCSPRLSRSWSCLGQMAVAIAWAQFFFEGLRNFLLHFFSVLSLNCILHLSPSLCGSLSHSLLKFLGASGAFFQACCLDFFGRLHQLSFTFFSQSVLKGSQNFFYIGLSVSAVLQCIGFWFQNRFLVSVLVQLHYRLTERYGKSIQYSRKINTPVTHKHTTPLYYRTRSIMLLRCLLSVDWVFLPIILTGVACSLVGTD